MKESIIVNEQQLLKWLINNPSDIFKIEKDEYFLNPISLSIYEGLKNLDNKNIQINIDNLLVESNNINDAVEIDILTGIMEKDIVDFDHHYTKLKHNYIKDKYNHEVLKDITQNFQVRGDLDIDKIGNLIEVLQDYEYELKNDKNKKILSLKECFDEYYETLINRNYKNETFSYGCSYLTKNILRGAQPGEMTAIYSSPGMGKSTFDLYLFHKQKNLQIPTIYFTPENSRELTMDRLICMKHRIPFKLLYPNLNQFEEVPDFIFDIIKKEKSDVYYRRGNKAFICDDPIISIRDLEKYIVDYKKQYGFKYMICHLDLASMFSEFNYNQGTTADNYEKALNQLHFVAKKTNCHFINVFQSRRPSDDVKINSIEDLDKLKPQIRKLKNSGAIEERCRVVIGLFRRKHYALQYLPDNPESVIMDDILDVMIQKQNTGAVCNLRYLYNPETYYVGKFIEKIEAVDTID